MVIFRANRFLVVLVLGAVLAAGVMAEDQPPNALWFTPDVVVGFSTGGTSATVGGSLSFDRLLVERFGVTGTVGGSFSQHTDALSTMRSGVFQVGGGAMVVPFARVPSLLLRPSFTGQLIFGSQTMAFAPVAAVDVSFSPSLASGGGLMLSAGVGANFADGLSLSPRFGISFGWRF